MDELLEEMKGLFFTKEERKVCNVMIKEDEKRDPSGSKRRRLVSAIGPQLHPDLVGHLSSFERCFLSSFFKIKKAFQ